MAANPDGSRGSGSSHQCGDRSNIEPEMVGDKKGIISQVLGAARCVDPPLACLHMPSCRNTETKCSDCGHTPLPFSLAVWPLSSCDRPSTAFCPGRRLCPSLQPYRIAHPRSTSPTPQRKQIPQFSCSGPEAFLPYAR